MKIKKVDCTQFAGMTGKHYEFQDGLNLLIGDNETGKSTMADLIFQVLFKDPKVNMKTDKQFSEKYYLKKKGDTTTYPPIGSITYEGTDGEYTLSKVWAQTGSTVRMTCPDGTVLTDPDTINKKLKEQLIYQAGVYDQIAFASQKRDNNALGSILKAADDKSVAETRTDLKATLGKAAMETGGVSIDKVQKELDQKLKELGDHWDFDADLPVGGAKRGFTNPWVREVGEILGSYYKLEQVKHEQNEVAEAESVVESLETETKRAQKAQTGAEEKRNDFQKYSGLLKNKKTLSDRKDDLVRVIGQYKKDADDWPEQLKKKADAKLLQQQLEYAMTKALYQNASAAKQKYADALDKTATLTGVCAADAADAADAERKVNSALSRLAGMNIEAEIKNLGSAEISVINIKDGSAVEEAGGRYAVKEAVLISIPGVAEVRLMPKGVDATALTNELNSERSRLDGILRKYCAKSVEDLRNKEQDYKDAKSEEEIAKKEYESACCGKRWADIQIEYQDLPEEVQDENTVTEEIEKLCGNRSLEGFIGSCETRLADYSGKYQTQNDLAEKIRENEADLDQVNSDLKKCDSIPAEYGSVDPDEYVNNLDNEINHYKDLLEGELKTNREQAYGRLANRSSEDFDDALEDAKRKFEEKKEEYSHWKHISEVFTKLKESSKGNPAEDIEKSFRKNLDILTGGTISLGELNGEFTADLSSKDHPLTMETISEGTRDTLSLAFRLAMLEHLFPDGGAVAVFDDPFTDMDPTRVKQACGLIEDFAKKNQVIFITCDNKYETLMKSGNCISADA